MTLNRVCEIKIFIGIHMEIHVLLGITLIYEA